MFLIHHKNTVHVCGKSLLLTQSNMSDIQLVALLAFHELVMTKSHYYIAINIEWLKLRDKSRVTSVQISLDIGTLTRYCTLTRMPSHDAVT